MLRLNIPTIAFARQEVSLGGLKYIFIYSYNEYDERWRIDIYHDDELIIAGIVVMENTSLLAYRFNIPDFEHGDLLCFKVQNTKDEVSRNNLGIGKPYEVIYFSNEELGI